MGLDGARSGSIILKRRGKRNIVLLSQGDGCREIPRLYVGERVMGGWKMIILEFMKDL